MGGKKEEKKVAPEDLTLEERAYYRETWGFDPVAEKKTSPPLPDFRYYSEDPEHIGESRTVSVKYYYDATIPLENDPELQAAGVTLHARVAVDEEGVSHNRIIFTRGDKSASVRCVHTAVYAALAEDISELPGEDLDELVESTEGIPAILPPWEHFAGATVNC